MILFLTCNQSDCAMVVGSSAGTFGVREISNKDKSMTLSRV